MVLLASGYSISTGIDVHLVYRGRSENPWLTGTDVLSLTGVDAMDIESFKSTINHAQTIVGYKAGPSWDSENPED